jgi:hypothetical protein
MINNQNLFPLPYWAPSFWRVPMPLHLLNEAYTRGPAPFECPNADMASMCSIGAEIIDSGQLASEWQTLANGAHGR